MEFKLREMMEWECKRIAAAFGVEQWQKREVAWAWHLRGLGCKDLRVSVDIRQGEWYEISVRANYGPENGEQEDDFESTVWRVPQNVVTGEYDEKGPLHYYASSGSNMPRYANLCSDYDECLVCGLYRLGIEDERILAELNFPLSAQDKLELRLSMPREFWPMAWLDTENGGR